MACLLLIPCQIIIVYFLTGLVVILLVVAVSCETDKEKARDGEKSEDSEKVEMMPYVRELTNE